MNGPLDNAAPSIPDAAPTAGRPPVSAAAGILAAAALLASSPLWPLVALLVRVCVGRPLLFRQRRAGQGGHVFSIAKFRTMIEAHNPDGTLLPDHRRQTPVTRFLRRMRLDELPQLLAILRGDMSMVGPRPLLPQTVEGFGELGRLRGSVRPGITGWAQVNGNTRLTEREKLALDIWYVRHQSFALDCEILLRTVWTVLAGERVSRPAVDRALAELAVFDRPATLRRNGA